MYNTTNGEREQKSGLPRIIKKVPKKKNQQRLSTCKSQKALEASRPSSSVDKWPQAVYYEGDLRLSWCQCLSQSIPAKYSCSPRHAIYETLEFRSRLSIGTAEFEFARQARIARYCSQSGLFSTDALVSDSLLDNEDV